MPRKLINSDVSLIHISKLVLVHVDVKGSLFDIDNENEIVSKRGAFSL